MVGRLGATITSRATNYLILCRLLPPCQFSPCVMYSAGGSSSSFAGTSPSFGRGTKHLNMGGNRGGSRSHGHGGARDTSKRIDTLGRLLTRILKHGAMELSLDIRSDGYVKLQDLLKLNMKTRSNVPLSLHSIDEIREKPSSHRHVAEGCKNRQQAEAWPFGRGWRTMDSCKPRPFCEVETESLLEPIISAEAIPICIHGTYKRLLEPILASGLKRMNRLHVHFACGLPSDGEVISGMRRDVNLLIFIDTKKAMEDGMKFYKSENEVILTEGFDGVVPAKYFQKIESWPNRKPLPFQAQVI